MFKRALLAASVAAAVSAPALAEVVVYGSARTGIEYSSVSGSEPSRFRLIDESSRIGFKGSDKLDNGMTVFWKSEHRFRIGASPSGSGSTYKPGTDGTNDASTGFGSRDSYVGVEGNFGTLSFGKQNDAYGDWINISPVLDGAMTNSEDSFFYQNESGSRKNNVAKYVSPVFGGFQASVAYDFGGKTTTYNSYGYSALLTWSNDMFNVGAAYLGSHDDGNVAGEKLKAFALDGVAKVSDALSLTAHWERAKYSQADDRRDYAGVGAVYSVGKWGFTTQYLKAFEAKDGVDKDDSAYQFNLGARYALSKNTTAFANYTYLKSGVDSRVTTTATGVGAAGEKANVVSISLRTDF